MGRRSSSIKSLGAAAVLWLLPTTLLAARTDLCQPHAECRAHARRGMQLTESKNYSEALSEFQAAYAIQAEPRLLVNMGRCLFRMGRPREALVYYKRYKEQGRDASSADRQALEVYIDEAQQAIAAENQTGVSQVVIRSAERGVRILIDGHEKAVTPVEEPISVKPGSHLIETRDGPSYRRQIDLAPGQAIVISLEVSRTEIIREIVALQQRAPRPRRRIVVGALALAAGVTMVGIGIAALTVHGRCVNLDDMGLCQAQLTSTGARTTDTFDSLPLGAGLTTAGLLLAASGTMLWAWPGARLKPKLRLPEDDRAAAAPLPNVYGSGHGIALSLAF